VRRESSTPQKPKRRKRPNSSPLCGPTSSVRSATKHWQPPEGVSSEDVRAVIAAAQTERDRRLLRTLWATGARVSESWRCDRWTSGATTWCCPTSRIRAWSSNASSCRPGRPTSPGALLVWAKEQRLAEQAPAFFSRKHGPDGGLRAISRVQGWAIVKAASERADVQVLTLRSSRYGAAGQPAPVHPHLFRMGGSARSCEPREAYPWPSGQPDGAGSRSPTSPSGTMRRARSWPRSTSWGGSTWTTPSFSSGPIPNPGWRSVRASGSQ
jgi:hypothetical protein